MRKLDVKYRIIIVISLMLLSVITIFLSLKNENSLYFSKALREVFFYPFKDVNNNDDLIGSNINEELKKENSLLKAEAGIKNSLIDFDVITSTVVKRNSAYFNDVITINKGLSHGISEKDAVVVSEGLVGIVINVGLNFSDVRLITSVNNENKFSVVVNNYNKVLESVNNELIINGIYKTDNIKRGDIVKTSGLTNIFPSGIIIGEISSIKNNTYDSGYYALIKLRYDIDNLRFVSVLKRKS